MDISTARLVQSLGADHYQTWNQLYHEIATKWILNAVTTGAHVLKGKIYQNIMVDLKVRYVYISICGLLDFWHNRIELVFEYPGSVDYDHGNLTFINWNSFITKILKEMGEWVIVVQCQISNFSAISWQGQVTFQWDYDDVSFLLDQPKIVMCKRKGGSRNVYFIYWLKIQSSFFIWISM